MFPKSLAEFDFYFQKENKRSTFLKNLLIKLWLLISLKLKPNKIIFSFLQKFSILSVINLFSQIIYKSYLIINVFIGKTSVSNLSDCEWGITKASFFFKINLFKLNTLL